MRRRLTWVVGLVLLACPAQAAGAVTPLARSDDQGDVALAGPNVLTTAHARGSASILSMPLTGGPFVRRYTYRGRTPHIPELVGSPLRAAAVVWSRPRRGRRRLLTVAGAPTGPLTTLAGLPPTELTLDGSTVAGNVSSGKRVSYVVHPAGQPPVRVPGTYPTAYLDLAGELVAFPVERRAGDEGSNRIRVMEWRTGRVRFHVDVPGNIVEYELAPSGRLLVATEGPSSADMLLIDPGRPARRIARDLGASEASPTLAGDHVVFRETNRIGSLEHLRVVSLTTGRVQRLSVPTALIPDFAVQGDTVVWNTETCLMRARLSDVAPRRIPAGPCPRSEVLLQHDRRGRVRQRKVALRLRCVTSDGPRCRGEVKMRWEGASRVLGTGRFSVPVGALGTARVLLTRRGARELRRFRRKLGRLDETALRATALPRDAAGRVASTEENVYFTSLKGRR